MLVGLTGFIGSGKTTVANLLVERHGYRADSFAASVKDALATIFGWSRDMLEGDTLESRRWRETVDPWWSKELGIPAFSPRYAMTFYGTDVMRKHFHQDIWLLTVKHRMHNSPSVPVVMTDVRFANEVNFVKSNGGKFINIQRGTLPEWYDTAKLANGGNISALNTIRDQYSHVHPSEYSWIGLTGDTVIHNNGTIDQLAAKIGETLGVNMP